MNKRRYNYFSHMVDATSDAVSRASKISAFWATAANAVVTINLVIYLYANLVNVVALVLLSFMFWCSVFGILMFTQLSWIAFLTYDARVDFEEGESIQDSPTPLPSKATKYYIGTGKGYKIDKVVEEYGGVGGKVEDNNYS